MPAHREPAGKSMRIVFTVLAIAALFALVVTIIKQVIALAGSVIAFVFLWMLVRAALR